MKNLAPTGWTDPEDVLAERSRARHLQQIDADHQDEVVTTLLTHLDDSTVGHEYSVRPMRTGFCHPTGERSGSVRPLR